MKKERTSQEALLSAALALARSEGVSAVSMRRVASACGVALGTVYHYYSSKEALLVAVMERFWQDAFHGGLSAGEEAPRFLSAFSSVWNRAASALRQFETSFLQQMYALDQRTRQQGKLRERQYFAHLEDNLTAILRADSKVSPDLWTPVFTPEQFVSLLMAAMLDQFRRGAFSPDFLLALIQTTIYKEKFHASHF